MFRDNLFAPQPYKKQPPKNESHNNILDKTNNLGGFLPNNNYSSYHSNSNDRKMYHPSSSFQNKRDFFKNKSEYIDSSVPPRNEKDQEITLVVFVYEEGLKSCTNFSEMIGSVVLVDKPIKFYVTNMENIEHKFFEIYEETGKYDIKNVLIVYFTHASYYDEYKINDLAQQYFGKKIIFGLTINFVGDSEYEQTAKDKVKFTRSLKVLYNNYPKSHLHMLQFVKMKDISKTFEHIKDAFISEKKELTYHDLCLREDSVIIPIFTLYQTMFDEKSRILDI